MAEHRKKLNNDKFRIDLNDKQDPTPSPENIAPSPPQVEAQGLSGPVNPNEQFRESLEPPAPEITIAPGSDLGFTDRLTLGFIEDPINRKSFLESKGITPEEFDEQDENEGLFGLAPAELADQVNLILKILSAGVGAVAGGTVGAATLSPVGAIVGAAAGGGATSALYDSIRKNIVNEMQTNKVDDAQLFVEVATGLAGPFIGKGISKVAAKVGPPIAKSAVVQTLIKEISKASDAVKDRIAGATSLIIGGNKQSIKTMINNPEEAFKVAREIKVNPKSILTKQEPLLAKEKIALGKSVNNAYGKSYDKLKPKLKEIEIPNSNLEVIERATDFLDNLGNPIIDKTIISKPGPLVEKAADFLNIESAEAFLKLSKKEILQGFTDVERARVGSVFDIIKKSKLTFNDVEIVRKARNSLAETVARGKPEAKKALAFVNRIFNSISDDLPIPAKQAEAFNAFKALNNEFKSAYETLGKVDEVFASGKGLSHKLFNTIKKSLSDEQESISAIDFFRSRLSDVIEKFAPGNNLLKRFDIISSGVDAQRLLAPGARNRIFIGAGAGGLIGQGLDRPVTGSLIGAGVGLLGQSPRLGAAAGQALGQAPATAVGKAIGGTILSGQERELQRQFDLGGLRGQ